MDATTTKKDKTVIQIISQIMKYLQNMIQNEIV